MLGTGTAMASSSILLLPSDYPLFIEETETQNNHKNTDIIATVIIHIERYIRP